MKKLLGILSVIGLVSVPATMVVGCGTNNKSNNNSGDKPEVDIKTLTFDNVHTKADNGTEQVELTFNLANEQDKGLYNLLVALQDKENKKQLFMDWEFSPGEEKESLTSILFSNEERTNVSGIIGVPLNKVKDFSAFLSSNSFEFNDGSDKPEPNSLGKELMKEQKIFYLSKIDYYTTNNAFYQFLQEEIKKLANPDNVSNSEWEKMANDWQQRKDLNYSDDFKIEVQSPDKKILLMN